MKSFAGFCREPRRTNKSPLDTNAMVSTFFWGNHPKASISNIRTMFLFKLNYIRIGEALAIQRTLKEVF